MSFVSRRIHTRQCCCTVFTIFPLSLYHTPCLRGSAYRPGLTDVVPCPLRSSDTGREDPVYRTQSVAGQIIFDGPLRGRGDLRMKTRDAPLRTGGHRFAVNGPSLWERDSVLLQSAEIRSGQADSLTWIGSIHGLDWIGFGEMTVTVFLISNHLQQSRCCFFQNMIYERLTIPLSPQLKLCIRTVNGT